MGLNGWMTWSYPKLINAEHFKGDVPRDEENRVPESAIKYGPLVDRTGYRCKKCMMNIHIDCAREAERLKISMVCFGTPDPRSTHKLFPEHGVGHINHCKNWHENLVQLFLTFFFSLAILIFHAIYQFANSLRKWVDVEILYLQWVIHLVSDKIILMYMCANYSERSHSESHEDLTVFNVVKIICLELINQKFHVKTI